MTDIVLTTVIAEWGISKVVDILWNGTGNHVKTTIKKTDLEKAIAVGLNTAQIWEKRQPIGKELFFRCEPKKAREFCRQVFQYSGVLTELERPLRNEGQPRTLFLIEAFKQVEVDLEIRLNEATLELWIGQFVNAYFERTTAYINLKLARDDYFKQLVIWFDDVDFGGIAVGGQEIESSKKLAQIFIMPDAIEEKANYQDDFWEVDLPSKVRGNLQADLLWQQRQQALSAKAQWSGQKIRAAQLLSQNKAEKLVLLGAPGSGKTTLMKYFALKLAEQQPEFLGLQNAHWLPILLRIRDLAQQSDDISILDYVRRFAEKTLAVKPLPGLFFEYWLEDGRALILLDGLDEVAEDAKRHQVMKRIENFLGQYKHNKAIITSRPTGYRRDFFRTEEFPHYQLQPFDDLKIEEFINRWYDSRTLDQTEAERRKNSLKRALAANDRIKLLARNPLLLTIIALIHRYQAQLPRERYKLYDKAVETLLTTWDANREITNYVVLKHLDLSDLRRLMERLAYWIHSYGGTNDQEGGTLIDREELVSQLSQYIQEQKKGIERYKAKAEAEMFLKHIRERTGLLNEQGQDCYAFVHKTFQEYLVAQEIRDRQEEGFEVVLEHIQLHLHNPHWREVLLLLIAQQKRGNPTRCLQEILQQNTPYERWLNRNLFFAGKCLSEDLTVNDDNLIAAILERLVELEVTNLPTVTDKIRFQVSQTLCELSETQYESKALQLLVKVPTEQIDKVRLQRYRAFLGEREGAIATLLTLLQSEDFGIRSRAAETLGELGNASEPVVQALIELLQSMDLQLHYIATQALARLGKTSETVVQALLELIQDKSYGVHFSVLDTLNQLGNTSEPVLQVLLGLLQDKDFHIRSATAETLGELGNASEPVIQALIELLQDEDFRVRFSTAKALGWLGNASEPVIQALIKLLQDEDYGVRFSAANSLTQLDKTSEPAVQALVKLLQNEDYSFCFIAIEALGQLGNASEPVVQGLVGLLEDKDYRVRSSVAEVLGQLGNTSEPVVQGLLRLLKDKDYHVCSSVAEALGQLGNTSEPVVQGLLELLQDEDPAMCFIAIKVLGKLGNTSQPVVQGLLGLLEDENSSIRFEVANALVQLGNASEPVIQELIRLLQNENPDIRFSAAETLGELGNASDPVVEGLLKLLQDSSHERSEAVDALGQLGNTSESVVEGLLELLENEDSRVRSRVADTLEWLGRSSSSVASALAIWIEQHQNSMYVGTGINLLWSLIVGN